MIFVLETPFSSNIPAYSIVLRVVLECLNTPVSCTIPVYKHCAHSLEILSSSKISDET